jgi:hypothetical protein
LEPIADATIAQETAKELVEDVRSRIEKALSSSAG